MYPSRPRALLLAALSALLTACLNSNETPQTTQVASPVGQNAANKGKTRYEFNQQCIRIQEESSGAYIRFAQGRWQADATGFADAEAFFFKPAALGQYLLYTQAERLLTSGATVNSTDLAQADPAAIWSLRVRGDLTDYPPAPNATTQATPETISRYVSFQEPNLRGQLFSLGTSSSGFLSVGSDGGLTMSAEPSYFRFIQADSLDCAVFPEAQSNVDGETFKAVGTLGWADTHLHATSTQFLGGAKPGSPFHPFGVTHALDSCEEEHGPTGHRDVVGSLFTGDVDGHATDGWPTFTDWPTRTATTHEATYWKWIERAWKSGLRLVVNFAVENQTLCEIQRNVAGEPTFNCNEMDSAKKQINASWGLQDYIDAQYGGRGEGWWRIVTNPEQAREVIEQGKVAVLLGIEVSNLMDCSVTFNPANTQEGFEETNEPGTGQIYGCSIAETGAANEIAVQLKGLRDIGVSNLFTVHEFDNAFGGSEIFDGLVLNLGTKENSGGVTEFEKLTGQQLLPDQQAKAIKNIEPIGVATGEFWSTHNCPTPESEDGLVFPAIGAVMTNLGPPPPLCQYMGRGGRPGGKTACYPAEPQCNARTLTSFGLYTFGKIMEMGFNFEIDHLSYEMKNQLLDLTEAQNPMYPTVSAHGFSGLTVKQARRIYKGGGLVYPTYNDTADLMSLWVKLKQAWVDSGADTEFAMGWGSDTNGLSPQANPRSNIQAGREVQYPFTLFEGGRFDELSAFKKVQGLQFDQPSTQSPDGLGRTWHVDVDGNAHYGMAADSIAELNIEAPSEMLGDVFNSAEVYLQYWERTRAASKAIQTAGLKQPDGLIRPASR